MSFRKRSTPLNPANTTSPTSTPPLPSSTTSAPPGTRPSPLDGRPTTSTGTPTLDALFGGHAGLPLGTSLLIEESGTTDFAGAVLRFYAAEGVVQGQRVHVLGIEEGWGRELPGLVAQEVGRGEQGEGEGRGEKMKIAWRYEGLGEFGEGRARVSTPNRSPLPPSPQLTSPTATPPPFCHSFDLTKRLIPPPTSPPITYHPLTPSSPLSLFTSLLSTLTTSLTTHPHSIHRLLLPSLLSPLIYPPSATHPPTLLPFIHSLRSLLRRFPTRLSLLLTLPLFLHPRSTGLVRWIELLCDGVIELTPFPHGHRLSVSDPPATPGATTPGATTKAAAAGGGKEDEKPQGLLKVWRVPVQSEKGMGTAGVRGEDMAFWVSRRRFVVRPFSLPPVEGDLEAQEGGGGGVGVQGIDF